MTAASSPADKRKSNAGRYTSAETPDPNRQMPCLGTPYPASILKGAKASGISLPYSCEAGRCGNCVARCLQGSVWHSYNEVLTEKEEKQGLILTCVGHPVGGDVVLEIGS